MPNYSLIFARTLQDADDSAMVDWKWDRHDELHSEYRRPDTGERARFVPDGPQSLQNLRWKTRVYLGRNWGTRSDALLIRYLITPQPEGSGFFETIDPVLPPPRPRAKKDEQLGEIRRMLARIGGES